MNNFESDAHLQGSQLNLLLDLWECELAQPDGVPIYLRIASTLRLYIYSLEPQIAGPRIPTVADLAQHFHANANTVLRALHLLRDEGVVSFGRGKSISVRSVQSSRQAQAARQFETSVKQSLSEDLSADYLESLLRRVASTFNADRSSD